MYSLSYSSTNSLARSLTHTLTYSFTHGITHSIKSLILILEEDQEDGLPHRRLPSLRVAHEAAEDIIYYY